MQGVGEGHEPGGDPAGLGEAVELLLGRLDLVLGGELGVALASCRGDLAADADQVAPQGQVIDRPGVVGGVGGRRGAVDQVGQVAHAAQFFETHVAGELLGQQDRFGELALADIAFDGGEQALVERFEEVARLQAVADPLEGGVVVEQRAEQRLLGLHIGRRVGDRRVVGDGPQVEGGNKSHGLPIA